MASTSLTAQGPTATAIEAGLTWQASLGHLRHLHNIIETLHIIERKVLFEALNQRFGRPTRFFFNLQGGNFSSAELDTSLSWTRSNIQMIQAQSVTFPLNSRDVDALPWSCREGPDRFDHLAEGEWGFSQRGQDLLELIDMLRLYADRRLEDKPESNGQIMLSFNPASTIRPTPKERALYDMACSLIGMEQLL